MIDRRFETCLFSSGLGSWYYEPNPVRAQIQTPAHFKTHYCWEVFLSNDSQTFYSYKEVAQYLEKRKLLL